MLFSCSHHSSRCSAVRQCHCLQRNDNREMGDEHVVQLAILSDAAMDYANNYYWFTIMHSVSIRIVVPCAPRRTARKRNEKVKKMVVGLGENSGQNFSVNKQNATQTRTVSVSGATSPAKRQQLAGGHLRNYRPQQKPATTKTLTR